MGFITSNYAAINKVDALDRGLVEALTLHLPGGPMAYH